MAIPVFGRDRTRLTDRLADRLLEQIENWISPIDPSIFLHDFILCQGVSTNEHLAS